MVCHHVASLDGRVIGNDSPISSNVHDSSPHTAYVPASTRP